MHKNDLAISIETLAAFLDGSLPREEMERISSLSQNDPLLRAMIDASDSIDSQEEGNLFEDINLPGLDEIEIPSSDTQSLWDAEVNDPVILEHNIGAFINDELLSDGDSIGHISDSIIGEHLKQLHMSTKTYGYEPNYDLNPFDENIYQGYSNTCAIRSQEIILRDFGIMIPQEDLMKYAEQKGWFNSDPDEGGTDPETVGNILDDCGVITSRTQDATIYDIIAELRAGHRVIVGVDSKELWLKKEPNLIKRLFGDLVNHVNDNVQDYLGMEGATHALIVAGVNVNTADPSDIHVTLIDPGTGEMCVEYSFKEFEKAWEDSNHRMIATKSAAPYQYNYENHQMEPSGFTSDFIPSNIHLPDDMTNTFHLTDSYYTIYEDYDEPYDDNHIIPFKASFYNAIEHEMDEQGDTFDSENEDNHSEDENVSNADVDNSSINDEDVDDDDDNYDNGDEDDDNDGDDNDYDDYDDNDDNIVSSESDEEWSSLGSKGDESLHTDQL